MDIRTTARILAGVMVFRGLYALALFSAVAVHRLGWANPLQISGHFADLVRNLPLWLSSGWGLYASLYLLAGLLAIAQRRIALWVYALAMAIDFLIWVYAAASARYDMVWSGRARMIDTFFNLLDFTVLAALVFLARRQVLR